jgi:hypothetical protein
MSRSGSAEVLVTIAADDRATDLRRLLTLHDIAAAKAAEMRKRRRQSWTVEVTQESKRTLHPSAAAAATDGCCCSQLPCTVNDAPSVWMMPHRVSEIGRACMSPAYDDQTD